MNATVALKPQRSYEQIVTHYDPRDKALRYWIAARRPCFTLELLRELREFQDDIGERVAAGERIDYLVAASATPGVFNLGGDLAYFIHLIRARERAALLGYARACVDVLYLNIQHRSLPLTTVALVQGDALGGGFEAVLSSEVVIAERRARLGFPETLFNLMPGMGAYSLLARRVDIATTERLITSGLNYAAEDLRALGIVDIVAEDGSGEQAVDAFIAAQRHRRNAAHLLVRMRERVSPVTREELYDIAGMWAEAALALGERDLRMMERLVEMQTLRFAAPDVARVLRAIDARTAPVRGAPVIGLAWPTAVSVPSDDRR